MFEGDFQSYWSGTASYESIVPLINMDFDGLRGSIIEMLSGDHVPVDATSFQNDTTNFANKDDVITYLIHLGYLGYESKLKNAFVPNLYSQNMVQTALEQIKEKRYPESLLSYTGDILLVGINYNKKDKSHQCKIERYSKG